MALTEEHKKLLSQFKFPEHGKDLTDIVQLGVMNFQEFMMMYHGAVKEVKTKLEILNDEFSVKKQRNPIEFIKTRIKKPESILEKLQARGLPFSIDSIQNNIYDIAGARVICSFIDDIYTVADMLVNQDDIRIIECKDYIKNPKPNGYRSLHLIISIPVFFASEKKLMPLEVQIRTIAMDFWASLEHDLKYKNNNDDIDSISRELKECADVITDTDQRMLKIREKLERQTDKRKN